MELVQFNALEFHPWGAHGRASPTCADRIVFDLDPGPDVPWPDSRSAPRGRSASLLEELRSSRFLRTTGGKGLHVVVPLNPGCDWATVKPFARGFAETLATGEPTRYLATATKSLRDGTHLHRLPAQRPRRDRVASYSLRARPGAPVAMPLSWDELARLKRADAFDIESLPARLANGADPWGGMDEVKQDLDSISALPGAGSAPRRPAAAPAGCWCAAARNPYTGVSMPTWACLARLVTPSFQPTSGPALRARRPAPAHGVAGRQVQAGLRR